MADEPHFPPPEEGKRREGAHPTHRTLPSPAMPVVDRPAPEPLVVERPVPIEEDSLGPAPALATTTPTTTPKVAPKLTHEEVAALLAVEGALRPTPLARAWKRGRIIMVPTGLLGFAGHRFIGGWADVLAMAIAVAALLWCARPLFRRDAWS